jgi:hypothetical protein
MELTGKIVAIKTNTGTGAKLVFTGKNVVTATGEVYYAQRASGLSATETTKTYGITDNASIHLGQGTTGGGDSDDTDVNTTITGMYNTGALESGYPKANDTDGDNTGKATDVVTWCYYWSTTEGTGTKINEGAVVDSLTGASAALCHFDFGSTFDKTASDTLKVFINHSFSGTG